MPGKPEPSGASGSGTDWKKRLRRRVAAVAKKTGRRSKSKAAPESSHWLSHELNVHQIELEMQNEDLRRAYSELTASQEKYLDLYDFAPLSYLTISSKWMILEANLTAAKLLHTDRSRLCQRSLNSFIALGDKAAFTGQITLLFETGTMAPFEVLLARAGAPPCYVRLLANLAHDAKGQPVCRLVLSDVTERRRNELKIEQLARFPAENTSPVLRVSAQGILEYANAAAGAFCRALGAGVGGKVNAEWRARISQALALKSRNDIEVQVEGRALIVTLVPIIEHGYVNLYAADITEIKQAEAYQELGRGVLQILNESSGLKDCAQRTIDLLQARTGCDAVGLRLHDGDDYPYFAQKGFPAEFLKTETTLVERGADGGLCRDKGGNVSLGCTCGLVISGKTDPNHPLFTAGGSCWTNDFCLLLDIPPGKDPRINPRNQCIHQGYASVVLVPIRTKEKIIGLLQFNDRRKGRFSPATVELLEGIATYIGAAMQHKRDEEKILSLAAIITQADDAIISADYKGIITNWNPAAQKIFGYGAEEAIGRPISLLAPAGHQGEVMGNLDKILAGQNAQFEHQLSAKSGAVIDVWVSLFPIKDSAGTVVGVSGIHRDITERKQAAANREKLQVQLTQSQKMESIGRLAGGVAHDFNNLLTAIKGYGEFVLDALPEADPRRADTEEILKAADRAAALTQQLLAFSRRQILVPQVVDLNAAIPVTNKMLQRLIGENIKLELKLSPRPCLIRMDPGQLDQVILNLVLNARDAMPDGGAITLETDSADMDEGFFAAHPGLARGPLAILRVRDTGHGMTDEVKSHLFEPFFTTKSIGQGTGLGLATIFGIVTQSGCTIEVESAPERGTNFSIYFPQAEKTVQVANKDKDKAALVRGRETVLLVEDEEVIRRLAERALIGAGYTVLTAADGREALKALEQRGQPVDLLLTDVVMPGMNGRKLAQEVALRKMAPRTLFVSGYTDDAIVRLGMLQPGLAFLHKPFSPEALLRKMREVLDGPVEKAKP